MLLPGNLWMGACMGCSRRNRLRNGMRLTTSPTFTLSHWRRENSSPPVLRTRIQGLGSLVDCLPVVSHEIGQLKRLAAVVMATAYFKMFALRKYQTIPRIANHRRRTKEGGQSGETTKESQ